jgi:hypothetical protein
MSEEVWANFDDVWQAISDLRRENTAQHNMIVEQHLKIIELETRFLAMERDRQVQLLAASFEAAEKYLPLAAEESKHSHLK